MTREQPADTTAALSEAPYDRFAADYRNWWAPVIAPASVESARPAGWTGGWRSADVVCRIGTGTGTLALAALRRWPQARVIDVDPALRLLEMAEAGAREAGVGDRLTTRVGEAGELPLPDSSVDGALTSFVLQPTPNRSAAVGETFHVAPGWRRCMPHLAGGRGSVRAGRRLRRRARCAAHRSTRPADSRRPLVHHAGERGRGVPPRRVSASPGPHRVARASVHATVIP